MTRSGRWVSASSMLRAAGRIWLLTGIALGAYHQTRGQPGRDDLVWKCSEYPHCDAKPYPVAYARKRGLRACRNDHRHTDVINLRDWRQRG